MKRVLQLSRWVTVPLTVVGVIGLVALTYPGGVLAAYQDVRDSRQVNADIEVAQRFHDELTDRSVVINDRLAMKEAVIRNLIDGHLSLNEAVAQFVEWFSEDRGLMATMRRRFGDLPVEELATRSVIECVASMRTPNATAAHDRLAREYETRFARRLPDRP